MATKKHRTNTPKPKVAGGQAITKTIAENYTKVVPIGSPSEEQIADLAYTLWIQRGSPIGSPEDDWFRAEEELSQRQGVGGNAN